MTDTALPLSSGFRVDLDRASVVGHPDVVDPETRACPDHVVGPDLRRDAELVPRSHRSFRVLPGLDVLVALVSAVIVSLWTTAGPTSISLPIVWLGVLLFSGAYEDGISGARAAQVRGVLRAGTTVALVCWAAASVTSLPLASSVTATSLVLLVGGSLAVRYVAAAVPRSRAAVRRIVVVGPSADVERTIDQFSRVSGADHFDVAAACVPDVGAAGSLDLPVFRGLDRAAAAAAEVGAHAVVVLPGPGVEPDDVRRLGWQLGEAGVALCVGVPLMGVSTARTRVAQAGGLHLLHVRGAELRGPRKVAKHAAERAAAGLLLCALLPLMFVVALAVRHDSPGPALFRQTRVGWGGRTFTMYKFRTMTTDAEHRLVDVVHANEVDGPLFKLRRDPRVTRLGGFLRRYSLDELPQLINVVLGHMSLVGPRPALPSEVAQYEPDTHRRLTVRPGLTGLWQVSGRSDLPWEQAVRLDLQYVDNWSPSLDLRIVARTFGAVLGQRGAY